ILLPHSAQVNIVVPEIAYPALAPDDDFFQRRDGADRPGANQTRRFTAAPALDLDCQSQDLEKQHHRQDRHVTVAADESFHGITVSGFRSPVSKGAMAPKFLLSRAACWAESNDKRGTGNQALET